MAPTHANQQLATLNATAPVVDFWNRGNPNNLLVIHTHGMQDPPDQNLAGDLHLHATKSYALIVPFDRALNNAGFFNAPNTIGPYVTAFSQNTNKFTAEGPPSLRVYPYISPLVSGQIDTVLDAVHALNICDAMKLADMNPWPNSQHMHLIDLLLATHPLNNNSLLQNYDSFLLLACRSSTATHQIGMGGSAPTYPDGLYGQEDGQAVLRHPFRQRRNSI